jgi:hypothetical protein
VLIGKYEKSVESLTNFDDLVMTTLWKLDIKPIFPKKISTIYWAIDLLLIRRQELKFRKLVAFRESKIKSMMKTIIVSEEEEKKILKQKHNISWRDIFIDCL